MNESPSSLLVEEIVEPDLEITDAHHHLWDHHEPKYLLDDLLTDCASGHRVTKTIFVECGWSWDDDAKAPHLAPVGEVRRVVAVSAESQRRHGTVIAAIIGFADFRYGDQVEEVLDQLTDAGAGLLVGIRQSTAWDPTPEISEHPTHPGPLLLGNPDFLRGFRHLIDRQLTFDAWLYHTQLPELLVLARAFPVTRIVVDHLGGPLNLGPYASRSVEVRDQWRHTMSQLALCPNVFVKLGGIGMAALAGALSDDPAQSTSAAIVARWRNQIRWCIETFGVDRCMFESNTPVDKRGYAYPVLWNAFKLAVSDASEADKVALFRGTATAVYGLT